jgi:hypothetical protein
MALLDGLDRVPWSRLGHAYGAATDVPPLLRALVDPDQASASLRAEAARHGRSVFDEVVWQLYGNVFHQGSVYTASARTVPFFLEILRDGPARPELQCFILEYLTSLAVGYPDDTFPDRIDPEAGFAAADGFDVESAAAHGDDERAVVAWHRDTYLAVEQGAPELLRFLDVDDDDLAILAMAALTWFPRCADLTGPALLRSARDHRGLRRGTAIAAAAHLGAHGTAELAAELLSDADPLVAVHAASALVLMEGQALPARAFAVLTAPLGEVADTPTPLTGTVATLVARCLTRVPSALLDDAVDALIRQLVETPNDARLAQAASLLALLFPDGEAPSEVEDLSRLQARGLRALAEHGPFEVTGGTSGNFALLLGRYDLPSKRAKLTAWLKEHE